MALKRINSVNAGTKRPFRLQDMQDVWDGLNQALALGTTTTPRIISGFTLQTDNSFSSGVVAFKNRLYFHAATTNARINKDEDVYAVELPSDDLRIFADGFQQLFSYEYVALSNPTGSVTKELIGRFSIENVEKWRLDVVTKSNLSSELMATIDQVPYDLRKRVTHRLFSLSLIPVVGDWSAPQTEGATEDIRFTPTSIRAAYSDSHSWLGYLTNVGIDKVIARSMQATVSYKSEFTLSENISHSSVFANVVVADGRLYIEVHAKKLDGTLFNANDRVNLSFLIAND